MINHIDLSTLLRRTVCDLFSDLVTRPTGAAVRTALEAQLADSRDRTIAVIDFSRVGLLDFSCADEIVAKLLLRYCTPYTPPDGPGAPPAPAADAGPSRDVYFLLSGVTDSQLDAIEAVLERHALAIVVRADTGVVMLVGMVDDHERRTWEAMRRLGPTAPDELARAVGLEPERTAALLEVLCRRRLAMRFNAAYVAVGAAT